MAAKTSNSDLDDCSIVTITRRGSASYVPSMARWREPSNVGDDHDRATLMVTLEVKGKAPFGITLGIVLCHDRQFHFMALLAL